MQTNNFDHVDNFIDTPSFSKDRELEPHIDYAKFVFEFMRYPAFKQTAYSDFTDKFDLYCFCNLEQFKDQKVKVVFASRMGWVGIRSIDSNYHSYEHSVKINSCYAWSPTPN